jgi:uncharacterized membrane protein
MLQSLKMIRRNPMPPSRTRTIVIAGVLSAISILLAVTPIGYLISIAGVSATTMHIPVIIGAILEGPVVGALIGLVFGVTSLIRSAVAPNGPIDPFFVNPLLSILPRLFIGPVAWLLWRALRRWPAIGLVAAGAAGSITNTVLVLGMLGLLLPTDFKLTADFVITDAIKWPFLGGIATSSGVLEMIVSAVIVLAVLSAWFQIDTGRKKSNL